MDNPTVEESSVVQPIEPNPDTDQQWILVRLKAVKLIGVSRTANHNGHDVIVPRGAVLGFELARICTDYRRRITELRKFGWNIPLCRVHYLRRAQRQDQAHRRLPADGGAMKIRIRAWMRDGEWDDAAEQRKFVMIPPERLAFEEFAPFADLLVDVEDQQYFMLSTGLTDKNGKEIYEGDRISYITVDNQTVTGTVKFMDGCFNVEFDSPIGDKFDKFRRIYEYLKVVTINHTAKVIGNIYETPLEPE